MIEPKLLILASTSPYRKKLLDDAGFRFETMGAVSDEKSILDLPPRVLAAKRAEFKALDVGTRASPDSVIIGADQVLSLCGQTFDKVSSPEDAQSVLRQLSGSTHFLHSAFCLVEVFHGGGMETIYEEVVDVPMTMRRLSNQEISDYVATGEWQGSVGCYKIEGKGIRLFDFVGGDHSAIIGLPLTSLQKSLLRFPSISKYS